MAAAVVEDGVAQQVDKYIDNEFLPNRPYVCRIVLTNVSSLTQKVEILQQIPQVRE